LIHIKVPAETCGTDSSSAFSRCVTNFARYRGALALIFCLATASFGCGRADKSQAGERYYEVRGIVRGFSPDRSTIEIEHENITGFMPAMTMPFAPRNLKDIADLKAREALVFRLAVTDKEAVIDNIRKIAVSEVHLPQIGATATPQSPDSSPRLKEGDVLPSFSLTTEAGEALSAETLRGHPTLITFIFTRCPMPNFCPRMSSNFAELQKVIQNGRGEMAQARLLSITIDPDFDSPAVLKNYAQHAGADPKLWSFATGEAAQIDELTKAFAVYRQAEGGTISHGLTTALISREGKIAKLWRGNEWKPKEVLAALTNDERP
jgi:protein SCO1/2